VTAKICVSILPKNDQEALKLIEKGENASADLIEIRLDNMETSRKLSDLAEHTKIPLIAANKLLSEKGFFSGTEAERQKTLLDAAKCGFEYVDLDVESPKLKEQIKILDNLGAKTIVSYHNFKNQLSIREMDHVWEKQVTSQASVCKIVTTANRIQDNLTSLSFVSANAGTAKLVCFCMGEIGKVSRLLSPLFGAFFTFASLEAGSETAAGQMSIGEMRAAYTLLGQK
jgi:3-dehydroquinate dehydratase type I